MNAAALLQKQGWRGEGHSLDSENRGLAKPVLISRKNDTNGLGHKQHDFGNHWWLKAWDDKPKEAPAANPHAAEARSKLYASFTKAQPLEGTFEKVQEVVKRVPEDQSADMSRMKKAGGWRRTGKNEASATEANSIPVGENLERKRKAAERDAAEQEEASKSKKAKLANDEGANGVSHASEVLSASASNGGLDQDESQGSVKKEKKKKDKKDKKEKKEKKDRKEKKSSEKKHKGDATINGDAVSAVQNGHVTESTKSQTQAATVSQEKGSGDSKDSVSKSPAKPSGPHPESIAALRARGEHVELPNPPPPPKDTKIWLTEDSSLPKKPPSKREKLEMGKHGERGPQTEPGTGGKHSYKAEKYRREKLKREMKREYKKWIEIRANPERYRPDGTPVTQRSLAAQTEEKARREQERKEAATSDTNGDHSTAEINPDGSKKKKSSKKSSKHSLPTSQEELEQQEAAAMAKRQLKSEMQAERRKAKKMIRAKKKTENHIELQRNRAKKLHKGKRERDEALAKENGQSYEEYIAEKEASLAQKRAERDAERAKADGITVEELHKRRTESLDRKERAKEARKLGMTPEEYDQQAAEPSDSELGSDDDETMGLKHHVGDTFGRSPIDRIWARTQKVKEQAPLGEAVLAEQSSAASESDSGSDSDPQSDGSSDSDASETAEVAKTNDAIPPETVSASKESTGSTTGELQTNDFFIMDATPSVLKPEKKKVKDMTKQERAARLDAMRKRRAERAAVRGDTKVSKKARRAKRAQRKEDLIANMTKDILDKKRRDGKGASKVPAGGKVAHKQARREARKVMRDLKKGKISEKDVPASWKGLYGDKKVKRRPRGNGGREPKK